MFRRSINRARPILDTLAVTPPLKISRVPFLNAGHALDHLVMLIFPAVAISMTGVFGLTYAELLPLSLGGFIAFAVCALPAGWLGDRWSRDGMIAVFFIGGGAACCLTAAAQTPWQLAACLTLIGIFAAIYHPIAPALLVGAGKPLGRTLGVNGFFGNVGVASAALTAGILTDLISWRAAFAAPGVVMMSIGAVYVGVIVKGEPQPTVVRGRTLDFCFDSTAARTLFAWLFLIILIAGLIFNATTIAMPKVFDERLADLTQSATGLGAFVFGVFLFAGCAQLVVGPFIDRFSEKPVLLTLIALQAPCFVASAYAEGWTLAVCAAAMMFCVFGQIPVHDAIIGRHIADAYRARAYALRYFVSFGASAAAVPLVASAGGGGRFPELFMGLAVLSVLMLAAAALLPLQAAQAKNNLPLAG